MSFTVEVLRQDRVPVPSRPSAATECGRCGTACWLSERASDYLVGLVIADDVEIVCTNCNAAPGKEVAA